MAAYNIYTNNSSYSPAKTILIAENTEYEIDDVYILKSSYIRSIKSKVADNESYKTLRITLPKWVSTYALENIINYLKYGELPNIAGVKESSIQRLLWLSDFLFLEDFQLQFIKNRILPILNSTNSLVFLNESFKKLKISDNSSDAWYVLFNYSIDLTAKHLAWNYQNRRTEVMQMNTKVMEEVIERSLKYNKTHYNSDQKEVIEILKQIWKENDVFRLLDIQRKILKEKTLTGEKQPNVVWKLTNLMKITETETSAWKLGNCTWKLVAKMRKDDLQGNQLMLYLKFDSVADSTPTQNNSDNFSTITSSNKNLPALNASHDGIITIYFTLKANGEPVYKEIQVSSVNIESNQFIRLHCLYHDQIQQLSNRENEFIVRLNIDYTYAAMLIHISKNLEDYFTSPTAVTLTRDDLCSILRNLPRNPFCQEQGLSLIASWLSFNKGEADPIDILKILEWRQISNIHLLKILSSDEIRGNYLVIQFLEKEKQNKSSEEDNNSVKNLIFRSSFMSESKQKKVESAGLGMDIPRERGRMPNQGHQNGEVEHPRYLSLQREPSAKAFSLNNSIRSNEIPYVPKILQNRTMMTETSPSPHRVLHSRISSSPHRHQFDESFDKTPAYHSKPITTPHSLNPSINNLSYMEPKSNLNVMQSPTANSLAKSENRINNVPSSEGKKIPGFSFPSSKNLLLGQSLNSNGLGSPIASPTYNLNVSTSSLYYQSSKNELSSPMHGGSASAGHKNITGLASSYSTQRRGTEKRLATESEEGTYPRPRELSLGRGRSSYSDSSDLKRFNPDRFERQTIAEVRESYGSLEKSSQEKIAVIRRALQREKDALKNDIWNNTNVKNFIVNGKLEIFD